MKYSTLAVCGLCAGLAHAQSTTYRAIPTLPASFNAGENILPTRFNATAPDAQVVCPGYIARNIRNTAAGVDARLYLAGKACNAYGTDINTLQLRVQFQEKDRLNVQIFPANIPDSEKYWYNVPEQLLTHIPDRNPVGPSRSDFRFTMVANPFSFTVVRKSTGETLFTTRGSKIVFENQFVEFKTLIPSNANLYGGSDVIGADWRLNPGANRTIWANDNGDGQDANLYGAHPFIMDHRFTGGKGYAHGLFNRNFHGQEILVREGYLTWRAIGGTINLYFYAGPSPAAVTQSYVKSIGLPALQQYWTLGYHQCRWGYANVSQLNDITDSMKKYSIPLDVIWNDIDVLDQYRDFTLDSNTYPQEEMAQFLDKIHGRNQHYVPIVDASVYVPNPTNASDAYAPYERGHALDVFIKNPDGSEYYGDVWPGFTAFPDFTAANTQKWWDGELATYYELVKYDGIWIDLNEASSFCSFSCGTGLLNLNPVHPFFSLPGEQYNIIYNYPEGFDQTNSTDAAIASSLSSAQASAGSEANPPDTSTRPYFQIPAVTPGVRNINYPPYAIKNDQGQNDLSNHAISTNATHAGGELEYDVHSLFGNSILRATYNSLTKVFPGRRPWILGRSTAPGSGRYAAHWGGDNYSVFYYLSKSILQALNFALYGIPMFGVDTCGFGGNTDLELCSRWMQMSAFFTFYRNHNIISAISQEPYRWRDVIVASKTAMAIRYSMLPYFYTLMYHAHESGSTVMRALLWEFPNDSTLTNNYQQFMVGPGLMIAPALSHGVTTVTAQFPGGSSTAWYDYYTGSRVQGSGASSTLTVAAPLGHIPVYLRGGTVFPLQKPKLTVEDTRLTPYDLLVALTPAGTASGDLYIDDGYSINPRDTVYVQFAASGNKLSVRVSKKGSVSSGYLKGLDTVTILGVPRKPTYVKIGSTNVKYTYSNGKVVITGLTKAVPNAWAKSYDIVWGYGYKG